MKTKLFFLAFLTSLLSWGQGVEDFTNIPTASSTNYLTRTLVAYVEGATEGKDRMFDALTDYKSAQNFYSLIDDQVMTIQGKGLPFYQDDKVPLGIKIASNGIYKIAIGAIDGLFEQGQNII